MAADDGEAPVPPNGMYMADSSLALLLVLEPAPTNSSSILCVPAQTGTTALVEQSSSWFTSFLPLSSISISEPGAIALLTSLKQLSKSPSEALPRSELVDEGEARRRSGHRCRRHQPIGPSRQEAAAGKRRDANQFLGALSVQLVGVGCFSVYCGRERRGGLLSRWVELEAVSNLPRKLEALWPST